MLDTLGGDGETAIPLIRQAQSRCRELTVIVPDQAKSAGTLLALGAHHIYMGPASDLGPIDPQLMLPDNSIVAARAIIDAVEEAERRIQQNPATYPLHVSLLESVTALTVQQARDEIDRTDDLLRTALACPSTRSDEEIDDLVQQLRGPLIETKSHGAVISATDASSFGMPVEQADFSSTRWQAVWRLWTKYAVLNATRVYEGQTASHITYT
ncbi:SDH family Clp fold serine proteinase [Candidatus Palauibacter sp.]|uniref:SDH family Clp fold serine proteinase n=1 Tax=Candidatus Palauibacter sp. TaxID=3101350 RepID=UPI003B026D8F